MMTQTLADFQEWLRGNKNKIFIYDIEGVRSLQFCRKAIQSSMRLSDPFCLELSYTRAMMGFLLFNDAPRNILIVGLGGGSLSKYCYQMFPQARISTLEINQEVIDLRDQFLIPQDDGRFRVIHIDASNYLRRNNVQADIILLDGFDENGLPDCLSSESFYADCRRNLAGNGVLVANLLGSNRNVKVYLNRLRGNFSNQVWSGRAFKSDNLIAFALKDKSYFPHWPGLAMKADALKERYGLDLPWIVKNMRLRLRT